VEQIKPKPHPSIARESGRSSIPETVVIYRDAAAYWVPRLREGFAEVGQIDDGV
jgi:hypothetical protein